MSYKRAEESLSYICRDSAFKLQDVPYMLMREQAATATTHKSLPNIGGDPNM